MRDHPIPQDVVGYRFHIIGNMTLKQFAEIGAGCIVAFLIYTTNLYPVIKWPLIAIAVGVGALAAFVPFEERPLDHWLVTFFRVLYQPTKFFWKREPHVPDAFKYQPNLDSSAFISELDLTPFRRQRIKEYLYSVQQPQALDQFETAEQVRMTSIMSAFTNVNVAATDTEKTLARPRLKVRVRQLRTAGSIEPHVFTVDTMTPPEEVAPVSLAVDPTHRQLDVSQVAQDINIPETPQLEVEAAVDEVATQTADQVLTADNRAYLESQAAQPTPVAAAESATLNADLPFPSPPTEPNKLVGMILTPNNELINDAIVEVQAADGQVARAVKTNALGQFFVTTPLQNGTYVLLAEKDGFSFNPIQLDLNGKIVDPIEVRSVS